MSAELEKRVMRKISFRIVPFIMLLYFIAFIDRVNIGFAALTMNKDPLLADRVWLRRRHLLSSAISFEVPSNRARQGRSPDLDRPGDDHLGPDFRRHGVRSGPE